MRELSSKSLTYWKILSLLRTWNIQPIHMPSFRISFSRVFPCNMKLETSKKLFLWYLTIEKFCTVRELDDAIGLHLFISEDLLPYQMRLKNRKYWIGDGLDIKRFAVFLVVQEKLLSRTSPTLFYITFSKFLI